jgi:hypothetical protein
MYWITAKTGFRGRVTVIAIACFKRGFEIESPCASGETDFDPSYNERERKRSKYKVQITPV